MDYYSIHWLPVLSAEEVTVSETVLVNCGRAKQERPMAAKDLYCSQRFKSARRVAERCGDRWWILSAKHGLLDPNTIIEPYDEPLDQLSPDDLSDWAHRTAADLQARLKRGERVTFLTDDAYSEPLVPLLMAGGHASRLPFQGRSEAQRTQWFDAALGNSQRSRDLDEFYRLLQELRDKGGQKQPFAACDRSACPARGVYFFFEDSEMRFCNDNVARVVRVGTHAVSANSKSTLWTRLRTHRGTSTGGGSHRSSIMRLHIGSAMIARKTEALTTPTWGHGQSASSSIRESEAPLEQLVSTYIGRMNVLWLNIPDEPSPRSDRAYVEQNAIALLAGRSGPVDVADSNWLGTYSPVTAIRQSCLWNIDYVTGDYDASFLNVLEQYAAVTLGTTTPPVASIAPPDWRQRTAPNQMKLF